MPAVALIRSKLILPRRLLQGPTEYVLSATWRDGGDEAALPLDALANSRIDAPGAPFQSLGLPGNHSLKDNAMNNLLGRYGSGAVVTGAANGLGASFARQLSVAGFELLLVDRDEAGLQRQADTLRAAGCSRVVTVACDLACDDGLDAVTAAAADLDIGLLINNAGVSPADDFLDQDLALHEQMLRINTVAPMRLAHHFGHGMRERGRGGMIFLSSMSALQGTSRVAHYAATKAYNMILAESLWREWQPDGIDVLAFLPGQTRTPGFAGTRPVQAAMRAPLMEADEAVAEALAALGRRPRHIPGRLNRAFADLLTRLLPRAVAINLVGDSIEKMFAKGRD